MEKEDFVKGAVSVLPKGLKLDNPGGGISEIISINENRICYKRGNSKIFVTLEDLHDAIEANKIKKIITSSDLKRYSPQVFDSTKGGHSCNCTFLFQVLKKMGIIDKIEGEGKRGNPFFSTLKNYA